MTNKVLGYAILLLIMLKIAAICFTSLGLYGDEAQYWLWSQEPDLGYYSKPPLLSWFLAGYTGVFGDSFISLKSFPIVVYFFISYSVYKLCRSLSFEKTDAILCAISFLIIPAASLSSFLISTDLLLLLFWTISMILLLNTINSNSVLNFILLGFFLGLTFLAKYAAVYFVLSLVLLLIIDRKTLNSFKNNPAGILFFLLSFFLVLSPNIWWNLNNGWITFSHTSDNANLQNLNLNFYEPIKFLVSQIIMVGPFLFFSSVVFLKYFRLDFENRFLLIFSLPILLVVLVESFLVRANANWAAPALVSVFIIFFRLVNSKKNYLLKMNFVFNYFVAMFLFFSVLISFESRVFDRVKGVKEFTMEILLIIKEKDLVISDRIVFSNISYQMRNETNRVLMPYKMGAPITNHFQMSSPLGHQRKNDFFLLGGLGDVSYLVNKHQSNLIKEFDVPFSSQKLELYEVRFK